VTYIAHSFIHSFIQAISVVPLQVHYYLEVLPTQHRHCVGVNTPKCHRQLRVTDLPKEVELVTLWTKGDESTNETPHPTIIYMMPSRCGHAVIWVRDLANDGGKKETTRGGAS